MDAVETVLAALAAGMALVTAYLIKWAWRARTLVAAAVVLFLLGMMVAMLGGALVYYADPGTGTLVEGLWLASGAMSLSVVPLFLVFLTDLQTRAKGPGEQPSIPLRSRPSFAGSVVALALFNEFLMGWTFQLASGSGSAPRWGRFASAVAFGVNSPWFLLPMALEMGLTVYLLRGHLPGPALPVFGLQAAMMAFSPPLSTDPTWTLVSVVANSVIMFAVFLPSLVMVYRREPVPPWLMLYLFALLPLFGAMLAGIDLWVVDGEGWLFAASVLAQMSIYFFAVILSDPLSYGSASAPQSA